jgi:exopolysaccharide production protein ExoQ
MDPVQSELESQARKPPGTVERAFVVLALLLAAGAFMTLVDTPELSGNQSSGVLATQTVWLLIYLVAFGLLCRHCPGFLSQFFKEWPLVAFLTLAVLSTFWSDDPSLTFRRSIALSLTVMFGFYLAKRFSLKEQLNLLAWVCGICIFFSFPFGLLQIGGVVQEIQGTWHGIFGHKNILGEVMALSALLFLVLEKVEPERRWRMRLGILASLILMVLSRSATALVVTAMTFILFSLSGILRKSFGKALAGMTLVMAAGAVALFWVFTHLETFTDSLGRSVSMSGRLEVWVLCVVMALRKPWLGYGYSAFWLGTNGPSYRIWRALSFPVGHAHDGFLQVWLALGLAGVALLVLMLVVYTIRAASLVRRNEQPESVWPLMVMVFCFLYMLTEVTIPAANGVFFILFTAAAFAASSVRTGVLDVAVERSMGATRAGYGNQLGAPAD